MARGEGPEARKGTLGQPDATQGQPGGTHRPHTGTLVVGAGIFGLCVANALRAKGVPVWTIAPAAPSPASATPLGALAPHAPDRWDAAKQAQLDALAAWPRFAASVEARSGRVVGYRRQGRLIPLRDEADHARWQARATVAAQHWAGEGAIHIVEPPPGWSDAQEAALDTLAASVDARALLDALGSMARVEPAPPVTGLAPHAVLLADGTRREAAAVVLATGAAAFAHLPEGAGRAEKGQAALLRLPQAVPGLAGRPMLWVRRMWVVPRADDLVAVGSTSERDWDHPGPDTALDAVIETAREVVPMLREAAVAERWAGLRPRMADRQPFLGPHPDLPGVWMATGGFKTGLATAPLLAERLAGEIAAVVE